MQNKYAFLKIFGYPGVYVTTHCPLLLFILLGNPRAIGRYHILHKNRYIDI